MWVDCDVMQTNPTMMNKYQEYSKTLYKVNEKLKKNNGFKQNTQNYNGKMNLNIQTNDEQEQNDDKNDQNIQQEQNQNVEGIYVMPRNMEITNGL